MAGRAMGRVALLLGVAIGLAGCQQGGKPFGFLKGGSTDDTTGGLAAPAGPAEQDVEAPDVFQLSETGLWDGRPSLGGVWVAHGSVKEPERVMIRNPDNGRSVVGALFRREFDNPGPKLQVSSDAADALGLIAGQPQKLDVVALKREEIEPKLPIAEDMPPASAGGDTKVAAAGAETAKAKTAPPPGEPAAPAAASAAKPGAIDARPLPAAIEAAVLESSAATPAPAAADAGKPLSAIAAPATGALKRPYVQIGIFSVEANANKAADQIAKAGMPAAVRADQSNGKSFWRVIVGPAASEAERGTLAAKVKGLGYPDAYPVSK